MLPGSAVLIALFPNYGAVLTVESKLVGGPESDNYCYSEYEDGLHFSGLARSLDSGQATALGARCLIRPLAIAGVS